MSGATTHRQAVDEAWAAYGDPRSIRSADEVSANVSTNRVYRLHLDDGSTVVSKVSSYGSYFLFVEDHEQLNRCARLLRTTRFTGMLADIWSRDGRIFTWYDQHMWAVFYDDVPRKDSLPRVLTGDQIANLATEMAEFHLACTEIAPALPSASKTIKSDAIHLLDLLESPFATRNFELPPEAIGVLWKHTHHFLERLVEVGYDEWPKIPILIDWNLGNFSVDTSPTAGSACSAGGTTTGFASNRDCSTSTSSPACPAAPVTAHGSPTDRTHWSSRRSWRSSRPIEACSR